MNTEKLFVNEKTGAALIARVKSLARFILVIAMVTFGAVAAHAVAPKMVLSPTAPTVLENGSGTVNITLSDTATNATVAGITLSATSSDTNLVTDADLVAGGSGASRTLTITPEADEFGTATITVVATDAQPVSTTNTFTLHVSLVNQGPSNSIPSNTVVVAEESGVQTVADFVTDMVAGPASQTGETWTFTAITASGDPTNAVFTTLPIVATNGTLTFHPKAHSYGTNLVTLIMKNSGGNANHGTNTFTNTFTVGISQIYHAPVFLKVANVSIMENTTNPVTVSVTNWDYDVNTTNFNATNFALTAVSSDTNLETIDIATNSSPSKLTNVVFTLTLTPATNGYGTVTNTLVTTENGLSTTNSFKLTINHVNQAPSFTFDTNALISNMVSSTEETLAVTNVGFATNLLAGPTNANETNQTWRFVLTTAKGSATNALFTKPPAIATNGTLTYYPKAHSYGTNLVTVVMIDNGGTAHGGVDSCTNTFMIGIAATNHPPGILKIANQTMLENETNKPVSVTVWDYDQNITNFNTTNFVLTATSSDTNTETLVVSTNIGTNKLTNAVFSLSMVLGTNQFGVVTNTVVATEGGFSSTNTFKLTITHVNQAPSFTFDTNVVISNMLTSWEEDLAVTNVGFLTNLLAGPTNANETNQTWAFTVTTATGTTTNALFTRAPAIATNGTLTYFPKAHSYGTNLVTIVMKDNGGTANHGINVFTNTFLLAIERTNHVPNFLPITNVTVLENVSNTTAKIVLWDFDQNTTNYNATNFSLTATSGNTNLATIGVSTNIGTSGLTNAVFTLTLTPGTNQFGIVTNTLVATEHGLSATNAILLTITHVNQAPSFTFNTNVLTSNVFSSVEETLAVTNAGFLTNLLAGPTNESSQTWTFALKTVTNTSSNAQFTIFPAVTTNGTLTYYPKAHSYGTNLVTVVMTDSGGVANGGVDAYTNTFSIAVVQTNHAPTIITTNLTVLENATNFTVPINVWDYDQKSSNFVLTATSGNTNLQNVTVSTNVIIVNSTNATFTLNVALGTNQFGVITNTLVATEGALSSTNTMVVTITHVNQAPSYTFDTNVMTSNVLAIAENAGQTNITGFLTNLLAGPTNESSQTWSNTVITVMTNATNAHFTTFTIDTNGNLALTAATNSFGTNTVTVVMTDSGGTANGGVNSYTNHFLVQVAQVWYPPTFTGVTNKTILENQATNLTLTFSLYNHLDTNFVVTPVASDTNLATVSATMSTSNCTLTFVPGTNQNGTNTITITAVADSLTNSTNLTLTITPVTQPPSFNLAVHSYTVDQYDVAVTITNVVTNVSVGPTNQSSETVGFLVTNSSSNSFVALPSITTDGTNGTLTFTPGVTGGTVSVGIRATNSGSTANGGVNMSPVQTMTITIPANTFAGVTGTYAGLFYNTTTIDNPSSGYFNMVLATNGTFTGYLLNTSASNTFNGQFDISNYTATVSSTPYTLDLAIDTSSNQAVAGSITNSTGGWNSTIQGYRAGFSASSHTPLAGVYTMALQGFDDPTQGPPGDSIFSATISANGNVAVTGTMADDTLAAQASQLSLEGYYPLYIPLYSSGTLGSLVGWLNFTASGLTTNSGLTWFNLTGASDLYTNGFTNQAAPIASPYNASTHLSLTNPTVVLSGGDLETNLTNVVTVASGVITVTPATNGLSLTIDQSTGAITGQFVDPNSGATNAISGAVLQNTNINPGFFLGTNQGGAFILIGN